MKYLFINFEESAQTLLEVEESRDLPSASWSPRKAGGVVPKAGEPQSQRGGEDPAQESGRGNQFALPPPFCSIQTLTELDEAHPLEKCDLL